MRKFFLILTAVAGLAGVGFAPPARADHLHFTQVAPGVQVVDYDGWRERDWRRHERWREWHQHQEWLRWHRWHYQ